MLSLLVAGSDVEGQDLQTLKLFGRWAQTPTNYFFGGESSDTGLAMSDKWILAGATYARERGVNGEGAAQVFSATTGAWVRKILPPVGSTGLFGYACAISGNTALISSLGSKVYAYDLTTGKKLFEISTPNGLFTEYFGSAVAFTSQGIMVAAQLEDANRGAVYLFDKKGFYVSRLQPPDTVANDVFGGAIAVDGDLAVISAFKSGGNVGAAYLYNVRTGSLINKLTPTGAVAGDEAGRAVALTRGKVFLGAPFADSAKGKVFQIDLTDDSQKTLLPSDNFPGVVNGFGQALATDGGLLMVGTNLRKVYAFDLSSSSTTEMRIIHQPDGEDNFDDFGGKVSIANGTLVVSASREDTQATDAGALYLFRTITRPTPMTKVAARGDFSPGTADTTFKTFGDAFINPDGEVVFTSALTGFGSNGGRDTGFWSTMAAFNPLDLVLKSRDTVTGSPVGVVSKALSNRPNMAIYQATITGPGVTIYNKEVLMKEDGMATAVLLQAGSTNNPQGASIQNFIHTVQSNTQDRVATAVRFRLDGAAFPTDDTGIIDIKPAVSTPSVPVAEGLREGSPAGTTGHTYGQFTGRVGMVDSGITNSRIIYSTALQGPTETNQAVFTKFYGSGETIVAQRGSGGTGTGGSQFSTFIGEAAVGADHYLYRATVGAPATAANNEGLWRKSGGTETLLFRKGDPIVALNGLKMKRIIHFWGGSENRGNVIALVQLSGAGVTTANDQALLLRHPTPPTGSTQHIMVLMREGDPARGCFPATIGSITRVEVHTYSGQYLVLATLAGAPKASNLCLFRGRASLAIASALEEPLLRPSPVLRKGELFSNQSSKLKSISLPVGNITASGASSTGLGSAIQYSFLTPGNIVLTLEFDNGLRQIMKGIP